jgi:hypothetical protein
MKPRHIPALPRTAWLGRMARGQRPDRNPLRRASDRMETAVLGLLLAAFLAAAPLAAHAAGTCASARFTAEQRTQVSAVHQVRAVLLQAPLSWNADLYGVAPGPVADARWTAPDGHPCTGLIPVPSSSAAAGSTVLVWTDRAGQLADAARPGRGPGGPGRRARGPGPRRRADRRSQSGPLGAGQAQASRLGRGLAGDRPALEPPALGPAFSVTEVLACW